MKTIIIVNQDKHELTVASTLLTGHYDTICCSSVADASVAAIGLKPAVVILDIECCRTGDRYDPVGTAAAIAPDAGVVCIGQADGGRPYTRLGTPHIAYPYRAEDLYAAVRLAIAESVSVAESTPRRMVRQRTVIPLERRLLGESAALKDVVRRIALYAAHDAPVLIIGESGTGKELAAAAIHRASGRRRQRFLPVDCAAIPETLVESTLFGTAKGAYTGAVEKMGMFESARGGTLFLDEIGEMSPSTQAKFLRTLETRTGSRVGSVDPVMYDVRIVSATNAPLYGERARFRPEFVHRIDTLVLEMPALRDRKEDIPFLAESFLTEFDPCKRLSHGAISKLNAWDWPGNVRELRNVVTRAAVLSGVDEEIAPDKIEINRPGRGWQRSLF